MDTTDTEDQNTIRNFLNDLIDRQTVTGNAIKYNVDAMRETRQVNTIINYNYYFYISEQKILSQLK